MAGPTVNEGDSGSKRTPNAEEWNAAKKYIVYYYVTRNLPLSEVMEKMKTLGFVATERMYKARFNIWNMGKNAGRSDWLAFARLYEECRAAGIPEVFVQIHNKVRRIQDLRNYLKSHGEQEDAFFAEAIASQVSTPQHVHYCNAEEVGMSEDNVPSLSSSQPPPILLPSQMLNALILEEPLLIHPWRDLTAAKGPQVTDSSSASLGPHLLDVSFEQELNQVDTSITTTTKESSESISSIDMDFMFNQPADPATSAAFVEENDLGSFRRIFGGDISVLYRNAYGEDPRLHGPDPLIEPQSILMTAPLVQSQPPGLILNQHDPDASYLAAGMLACMLGAARQKESMNQCLQRASTSFRQICMLQSPFTLTVASTMLTWLLVHADRSLSERIMMTSFHTAIVALGSQNPICILLEWLTAAVAADKLKSCRIDSVRLWQLWQDFHKALGDKHGHTMVALYCLSFHLIFVDKNFAQAERYLEYLYGVSTTVFGASHIQTINILATLSRAQHRQKKYLAALETINKSLHAAPLGLNHPHRLELLLRKALILWRLKRMEEMEELYWIVVKGRVATLGIHHRSTVAAHESLVDVLHWNHTWEARKDDAHSLLIDPQVSVTDYESWWRRVVEGNRGVKNQDRASSEEGE